MAAIFSPMSVVAVNMPTSDVGGHSVIDPLAVYDTLKSWASESDGRAMVIFEQGQKNPKFGTKGNYGNGYACAVVDTVLRLAARDGFVRFQCVNPRTWQDAVFKDLRGFKRGETNTKEAAIAVCGRLYPDFSLVPARCRVPHDGWADALCMAEYARRVYAG